MDNPYILTSTDENIGIITINKPSNMNTIDAEMLESLAQTVIAYNKDEKIKAILLQGNDKFFASGIDIKELVAEANQSESNIEKMQENVELIANSKKPIIAAVSGIALGIGFEICLACDFILAADNAVFACPETSLSLIPSFGGIQRLVKTIGKAQASEMILTGKALKAEDALAQGLVSRIIPLANLKEDAVKTAKRIASHADTTIRIAKESIKFALNGIDERISADHKSAKVCFLENNFKQSLINLQNTTKKS